jgi:hypothetical protein
MADIEDDEPLFSKVVTEADKEELKIDEAMLRFAQTAYVSDEVRTECEAEMAAAKKRGWKIKKKK